MSDGRQGGVAEFTLKAVAAGLLFGCLFGAANAYLGLKAGLTVSTSIPIAVLSAGLFRLLPGQRGTILEANMAQTVGSASSSLAAGTIFTIPALFMWGLVPPVTQVALLALCGGLLGILAMVPLRRLLIVQADAELPYPEGRACAEVLRATERGGGGGKWIFYGIAAGALVKLLISQLHLVPEDVGVSSSAIPNASLALKIAPALLAVGFIVGFKAASVMVAGGLLAALVLYPLITKAYAAGSSENALLSAKEVRDRFVLFIGAGAVAAAGIVTVLRTAPTMWRSLRAVVEGLARKAAAATGERTDRDVPGLVLVAGLATLFLAIALVPGILAGDLPLAWRLVAALGVLVFGFVFVPVSSRLVGVIGVSSNPTSAMALITIAGTALAFALAGMRDLDAKAAVLTVGTLVCVAASKAGDISQDLKTGFMVGATPARQQYGQMIAAAVACWVVAFVVVAIGKGPEGFGEGGMPAPQARLMRTVVEAVLGETLPWDLLGFGAALSLIGALVGLPALPFALGIYLPLATLATVFVGGCVRKLVDRLGTGADIQAGILCASGMVAGEGLAGVLIAGMTFARGLGRYEGPPPTTVESLASLALLALVGALLFSAGRRRAS